jgi:hypothetical protein
LPWPQQLFGLVQNLVHIFPSLRSVSSAASCRIITGRYCINTLIYGIYRWSNFLVLGALNVPCPYKELK